MSYENLKSILWTDKGWPLSCAPAPVASALALETQTPEEVAETLENWVNNIEDTTEPPYGLKGWNAYRLWIIHRTFAVGREFWEYGTMLALGQAADPPLDKAPEAQSADEWLRNHSYRRSRLGFVLLDRTPEGDAELARRERLAADVPRAWAAAGKALIWRLAVTEGMIPAPLDGFSAAYAVRNPSLDSVRFLDADQWLGNLRADDRRRPRPWNDDGSRNLEF